MLLLDDSLTGGYQLGYTNDVELGMSGGPVLDQRGQLIGINGWSKYPIQGIDVFRFLDGTLPSPAMFERMEALSWAIPISTFRQKVRKLPFTTSNF
jgi:S1-C subfamily serine protease